MKKVNLDWALGYTNIKDVKPTELMPATVPGAVQIDYAAFKGLEPFWKSDNYKEYKWTEDVYWLYNAGLDFELDSQETATLHIGGIDYYYSIFIDGEEIVSGEGMFTPIRFDITKYSGKKALLEVLISPVPKCNDSNSRTQARESCKPAACYGWDWHPRLIASGIWEEAYIEIKPCCHIDNVEASYRLNDDFSECTVEVEANAFNADKVLVEIIDREENSVAKAELTDVDGEFTTEIVLKNPHLWYPVGYGEQYIYKIAVHSYKDKTVTDTVIRKVGFRCSRLVMNDGSWIKPNGFPKSRSAAPITLEINGRRIFAKGSNWVNANIFPGCSDENEYKKLLTLVKDANMNILRIWGGGYINKESFFELCDEMGIMVWQEFMLACNEYPDKDAYLTVLEKEATTIVKSLRTHPSVVLWCGGNELFNSWSKMTDQHHALRLLDAICYKNDRFTPFIMTSPLNGMAHGHYLNYDENSNRETITDLIASDNTAYTEFGRPGMPPLEYLKTFMDEKDIEDCNATNPIWNSHHGFGAWTKECWVRKPEAEYYFGGYTDINDLCEKTAYIQAMGYKAAFEEMRKHWPECSMALNWCFNEPWPTVANNSLVSWPDIPKQAYYAVKEALRPQIASLRTYKHLWWAGERFETEVWMLNDSINSMDEGEVVVSYTINNKTIVWGKLCFDKVDAQTNRKLGAVSFDLPQGFAGPITVKLEVSNNAESNSQYTYLCRAKEVTVYKVPLLNQ